MRYSAQESIWILGIFDSGKNVTIDVYRLSDDVKVVDGETCSEVGTTGVYKYLFSQTVTEKEEYLYIMTDGENRHIGKIVLGGWLDSVKDKVENNLDEKVSSRASQVTVDGIKSQTDKLQFTSENYVKSEAQNPELTNLDEKVSTRASQVSVDSLSSALSTHDNDIKVEIKKHDTKMTAFKFV